MDKGEAKEAYNEEAESEGGRLQGALLVLEATGILIQGAEPVGTTLVDSPNGFNKLSHLVIL